MKSAGLNFTASEPTDNNSAVHDLFLSRPWFQDACGIALHRSGHRARRMPAHSDVFGLNSGIRDELLFETVVRRCILTSLPCVKRVHRFRRRDEKFGNVALRLPQLLSSLLLGESTTMNQTDDIPSFGRQ